MSKALSVANVMMFFVFLSFVAVQYNDPDPYIWMPMYGSAALACWLRWRVRPYRLLSAIVGLVAIVWAGFIAPEVIGRVSFSDMFESFRMLSILVEQEREVFGLLIVAAWMGILWFPARHT